MDSHKQIPKCVLKHFHNDQGRFFCYNVENFEIRRSNAKRFNTEVNYYSPFIESQLCSKIETPLGLLISDLKNVFNDKEITIRGKYRAVIYNYIYSLCARSPKMMSSVEQSLFFKECYTEQAIHDFTLMDSLALMQNDAHLESYKFTFLFNHTSDDLLLPSDGYTQFVVGDGKVMIIFVPITSKIAFWLYRGTNIYDGKIIVEQDIHFILQLNRMTFEQQKQRGKGYVISSTESYLKTIAVDEMKE